MQTAYIYALLSNFSYGLGSQFFAHYSRKVSAAWVTIFKGVVDCLLFLFTVLLFSGFHPIDPRYVGTFLLSGFIGLGVGDIFLMKSFADIGPGRTMLLFAFQPLVVGAFSYFLFGQSVDARRLVSILFFIACVFIFSLEQFKKNGKWSFTPVLVALTGMFLDASGIILTRLSFNGAPDVTALEGNLYRSLGAVLAFALICRVMKVHFFANLRALPFKSKGYMFIGSVLGCYLALLFYLQAIKTTTSLAAVSSIAVTGVIFGAFFECLFEKKKPSKYLLAAFGCFFCAAYFLFC